MKPTIAITLGDFNGIGPEVTLKSLTSPKVQNICIPLLVGSIDVYDYYAQRLRMQINLKEVDTILTKFSGNSIPVFNIRRFQKPRIKPGTLSKEDGEYAGVAIVIAIELCKKKFVDGIVTAPVSKEV